MKPQNHQNKTEQLGAALILRAIALLKEGSGLRKPSCQQGVGGKGIRERWIDEDGFNARSWFKDGWDQQGKFPNWVHANQLRLHIRAQGFDAITLCVRDGWKTRFVVLMRDAAPEN